MFIGYALIIFLLFSFLFLLLALFHLLPLLFLLLLWKVWLLIVLPSDQQLLLHDYFFYEPCIRDPVVRDASSSMSGHHLQKWFLPPAGFHPRLHFSASSY